MIYLERWLVLWIQKSGWPLHLGKKAETESAVLNLLTNK
jgi:hypothetical protein